MSARYQTYQSTVVQAPGLRKWIALALVLSIGLHIGLFYYLNRTEVDGFVFDERTLTPPKTFNMKRVSIPEQAPPQQEEVRLKIPEAPTPKAETMQLAPEKPELGEVVMAPQISEMPKPVFTEKPRAEISGLDRLRKAEETARQAMDAELNSATAGFLNARPALPNQPRISAGTGTPRGGAGELNVAIPGLNSVNDLLAKTGDLKSGDRAAMPGGALFDYDDYGLKPEAADNLRQIGALFQRNPRATFLIEGHTDSFGSPDYNLRLSERRAESVKAWLVQNMGIAAERIQTRGLGNTKAVVTSDKSVEEQAPNRRVEIVVRTAGR